MRGVRWRLLTTIWFIAAIPTALLVYALFVASIEPRGKVAIGIVATIVAPMLALAVFTIIEYHRSWWPFGYGSGIPHVVAAAASVGGLRWVLGRASGSIKAKLLLAVLSVPAWACIWFTVILYVACSSGDCI
jgi:hypothetical protein